MFIKTQGSILTKVWPNKRIDKSIPSMQGDVKIPQRDSRFFKEK